MYDIEVRQVPALHLGAVSHHGRFEEMGAAFETLMAALGEAGLLPQVSGTVTVVHTNPQEVAPEENRASIGAILPEGVELPAALSPLRIEGGRAAVLTLRGPYEGLPAAWGHLFGSWLPASGERPDGAPVYEIYRNSPADTAPADLLTELHLPLA